ncbi:MAG: ribonucleotide reductase N-terminal alpha domain-containing protein [Desulfovermiculus sp.]
MNIPPVPKYLPEPQFSENALVVLRARYLIKGDDGQPVETPAEMLWRVAYVVALQEQNYPDSPWHERVQDLAEEFYRLMAWRVFLPNSPTLMNAGRPLGQLAACFVLPIEDSMEGIFGSISDAALIHKSGGGTGFSFSRLREERSRVGSTGGVASGPLSFLKIFDTATEQIKQGGTRRGANMGVLRVDHPDIRRWIEAKEQEGDISNFNLSVGITDDFMRAVEEGDGFPLASPHTGKEVERVDAADLFQRICELAHKNGEPGVLFLDTINEANPTPELGDIEATNPCVVGETWVNTYDGPRMVEDIVGKPIMLLINGEWWEAPKGFFETGEKAVYELRTSRGYRATMTWDHNVLCADGWKELGEIQLGDVVMLDDSKSYDWLSEDDWNLSDDAWNYGYLVGLLYGDGHITNDRAVIKLWDAEGRDISLIKKIALQCTNSLPKRSDFAGWHEYSPGVYTLILRSILDIVHGLGMSHNNKVITKQLESKSFNFCNGFLAGFFDTDGFIIGDQNKGVSVRLNQSDQETLLAVQRMLHRFGITSQIYFGRRPAGYRKLPDGDGGLREYYTKENHELCITRENILIFENEVGFRDRVKKEKLRNALSAYKRNLNNEDFKATVTSIDQVGVRKVYDVRIPGKNAFSANGIIVHNCGEEPLLPYEACNLGSINLAVLEEVTSIEGFYKDDIVYLCIRFLDNVIDASKYPLSKIKEAVQRTRKVGLGVMGWADYLFQKSIFYDSEEACSHARSLMEGIKGASRNASLTLALERGAYPACRDCDTKLRNANTTTIAPTGTLSMIAGCSSGIEPLFALAQTKTCLDGQQFTEINQYFSGHPKTKKLGSDVFDFVHEHGRLPDHAPTSLRRIFKTAQEISPEAHLNMQAAFQEYTDAAVSKTINLPSSATVEDVARIYKLAWEQDCKGLTVYRDGSRQEQVYTSGAQQGSPRQAVQNSGQAGKKPRPDKLPGHTYRVQTGLGKLYLTVNELDGKPFEVFATIGQSGKSQTAKAEAVGRLVSLCLRSDVPMQEIVGQLEGIGGDYPTFANGRLHKSIPDAVGWILRTMYLEGSSSQIPDIKGAACPECGAELVFQEGCFLCSSCGYTKCG